MNNRDPFAEKSSIYGKQRPGSESQASKTPSPPVAPSFPSRPSQGGTVPVPTRPVFPTPVKPAGVEDGSGVSPYAPPAFTPKAEDLFPSPQTPTSFDEDNDVFVDEVEETVEDVYEELFGVPLEGAESDYLPLDSEEEDLYEKRMVASDEEAQLPSLYSLAADPDPETRVYVASNPNTPHVLLDRLAKDPEADVREGVMENPSCPTSLYKSFVLDPDDFVVATWLDNPRTVPDMVIPLHGTKNPFLALKLIESSLVTEPVKVRLKQVLAS